MVHIILIRGAPATGKTTISKALLKTLKLDYKFDCAYICEDDFRKQMQNKYKAKDKQVHLNSAVLIQTVIGKLLDMDSYDYVFIEGQFRYPEVIENYKLFFKEQNLSYFWFQLSAALDVLHKRDDKYRNNKSKDIEEVKKDIDMHIPSDFTIINSSQELEKTCEFLLARLLQYHKNPLQSSQPRPA